MKITRIISTIVKALLILKHTPFNGVTRTNELLSPFGLDANPYPGIKGAVLSATSKGRGAVIGFFNKFVRAAPGERRMYSTDSAGNAIVTEIYQKNDGTIVITVNSGATLNGDLTVTDDLVVGLIDFLTHTHAYDDSGTPKVTGPPQ